MSKFERIGPDLSSRANLFVAITAEAWLSPDLADNLKADPKAAVTAFAKVYGFDLPSDAEISAFEVPAHPAGELDHRITTPTMTHTVDEYGCGTTAETGCASNNGTCPPATNMCASTSPSYCQTYSGCLSIQFCPTLDMNCTS